jgi:PASTA domain
MTMLEMDPVFSAALREALLVTARDVPRARRRWRWRLGAGMFVGSTLVAGGAALASGVFSQPGAPVDTPLANIVTVTHTGSATVNLGPPPAKTTNVSLTLTCRTVGTFDFPNRSSMSCDATDLSRPFPEAQQASEVVPLTPGRNAVTITTSTHASWTLQAVYVNQVTTPWGTNAAGQTYGVQNQKGTPDLIAVVVDHGKGQGYVKASELSCAERGDVNTPAQALVWDRESQNRNISIPAYKSDGSTVIGSFIIGDASGPDARTIPFSSLGLNCAGIGNDPTGNGLGPTPTRGGNDHANTTTTLSTGATGTVIVPGILGKTVSQATATLQAAGLNVFGIAGDPNAMVVSQDPVGDSRVPSGSANTLRTRLAPTSSSASPTP